MAPVKDLLELRRSIKSKKPKFIRRDTNKKKRLEKNWRRPTGLHSKLRGRFKGRPKRVSQGYRGPKEVRSLHKSGLQLRIVKSIYDLEKIDSKRECIIISSTMGKKKRIAVLKKSKELGFSVTNIQNPEEYIKKAEDGIGLRKKIKEEKKEKTKEVGKKERLTEKVDAGDRKEVEKNKKDKILTKKDK